MTHAISMAERSPRGLLAVRASADPATLLRDLTRGVEDFKAQHRSELDAIKSHMDELATLGAASQMGAGAPARVADPVYSAAFTDYVRSGEGETDIKAANKLGRMAEINASMNIGTPSDGGYLAPTEWDRKIIASLLPLSPLRRISTVVTTGVNAYSTLWNNRGWGSGWVGETAARPETTAATFASLTFGHGEIYANPAVTQRLLDDASINVADFLVGEVQEEFARQENVTFVAGNGTNKPNGFLTYATGGTNAATHPGGALDTVTVASATAITADELIGFYYGLGAPYRQNATWVMSSVTALLLAKLKDGDGNYLWREGLAAGAPATLLGRPIEIEENMPSPVASALPIALGDFKAGYVINDRTGIRVLRDPYTAKPYVLFYCTKRVGGGVRDPKAIRVLKMAAS